MINQDTLSATLDHSSAELNFASSSIGPLVSHLWDHLEQRALAAARFTAMCPVMRAAHRESAVEVPAMASIMRCSRRVHRWSPRYRRRCQTADLRALVRNSHTGVLGGFLGSQSRALRWQRARPALRPGGRCAGASVSRT